MEVVVVVPLPPATGPGLGAAAARERWPRRVTGTGNMTQAVADETAVAASVAALQLR
jgi:hypothetical protein